MILIGLLLGAGEQNLQLMSAGNRVEIRALAPEQLGKAGEGQGINPFLAGAAVEIAPMGIHAAPGGFLQVGLEQTEVRGQIQRRGLDRPGDDASGESCALARVERVENVNVISAIVVADLVGHIVGAIGDPGEEGFLPEMAMLCRRSPDLQKAGGENDLFGCGADNAVAGTTAPAIACIAEMLQGEVAEAIAA